MAVLKLLHEYTRALHARADCATSYLAGAQRASKRVVAISLRSYALRSRSMLNAESETVCTP
jgi:hypothetical protein